MQLELNSFSTTPDHPTNQIHNLQKLDRCSSLCAFENRKTRSFSETQMPDEHFE
ncbi:hypothetical protein CCM_02757 [Cordyceps militaris CM01]|uniref:Uncharacterized protein n=1 Tax=Cordyceps militaris (strain CM01) TaxID=983644 RepID=G3JBH9_CORMM|nr:uncharacterized protein CCM_02757 [Cordyceps militaris CM01]EGX94486.1 hypothetical protein CCM_02757 [Cordyceps militaris CM01]